MTALRPQVEVAGVRVDAVDEAAVRSWLRGQIAARPRPGRRVCTVNLDYLVLADKDAAFRSALRGADLAVADGQPVLWLSRLGGRRLPARITGSDLTTWLVDGGLPGTSLFLLGSTEAVCRAVAERAASAGVRVAGWNTARREVLDDAEASRRVAQEISESNADVLLTALGAPRQDLWLERHQGDLNVSVMIGVGGSLDLVAGRLRRAPRLVQRAGLEWAFRMLQEPRRLWRRYLVEDLPFLARQVMATRSTRRP